MTMAESLAPGLLDVAALQGAVLNSLDHFAVAVTVKDLASGRYEQANASAARLLGLEGRDLVGSLDADLFDATLVVALRAAEQQARAIPSGVMAEHKLEIRYGDAKGRTSARTIWPFAIGFFERIRVVVAWCELRGNFRHFRADRILGMTLLESRYPRRRQGLLRQWRESTSSERFPRKKERR